jgi:periplasmic protein TonB
MPTSKDNEVLTVSDGSVAVQTQPFRPDETSTRPNPVALEVPVSVNGARTLEGSDKREPFSETTKTVLVFGNGAVIRLSSPVAAGQLLFLTNEKTKKEVVCQVVKSKNYRNVSGYVELEFTESVVGFWGMRFPTDRVATASGSHSPGSPAPAAPKTNTVAPHAGPPVAPPVASALSKPVPAAPTLIPTVPKPVVPVAPVDAKPAAQQVPAATVPPPAKPTQAHPQTAPTIAASLASSVASLLSSPEVPPAAVSSKPSSSPATPQGNVKPITAAGEASTEELRQQAARLQEQLSSMLFSPTAPTKPGAPVTAAPVADSKPTTNTAPKVLEIAKSDVAPAAPAKLESVAKTIPPPIKSSLDTEEVKIPSWLEPLARNAAAPTSTQELIEREKAKHAAELATREETKPEPLAAAPAPEAAPESELPSIDNLLPLDEPTITQEQASGSSKKGLWIGVAAAVVLAAAGGGWYFTHPSAFRAGSGPVTHPASPPPNSPAHTLPSAQPPTQNTAAAPSISKPNGAEPISSAPVSRPTPTIQPVPPQRENARNSATTIPASSTERVPRPTAASVAPPQPEIRKPSIGEVHLASPTLNRSGNAQDDTAAAPTIGSSDPAAASLNSGLAAGSAKQPAAPEAPLPVGGDVKPAKLLSPVAPIYPAMAKAQHISGEVTIDALVDPTGKVTTMKILSGPALLRQAAMDALRQWKYQAATLDGKPVSMHLNVTVQFRLE